MNIHPTSSVCICFLSALLLLGGCQSNKLTEKDVNDDYETATRREKKALDNGKFFGEDTLVFGDDRTTRKQDSSGLMVNRYLWRASLEVLSFMPLAHADPFGGTILTDWYQSSGSTERIKVNVHILEGRLKADALSISVFRQRLDKGQWVDMPVDKKTAEELENAVLTKARQLRLETGL
jgi:uncharacterized lipoprotein